MKLQNLRSDWFCHPDSLPTKGGYANMVTLRIHLFGTFRLYWDTSPQEIRVIPNVQALLAFLLVPPGRMYSRDKIANLLWGELSEKQAHSCLNTALWRLRKVLEPQGVDPGTYLVCTPNRELRLNWRSNCWVDAVEFEQTIQHVTDIEYKCISIDAIHQLEQALALYNGELLEGCYYDWVVRERERLHLKYISALYYLLNFYQWHKEYNQAIRWGQQILMADPLREDVHRFLMRLYTENGQRALAVRQYQCCQRILDAELGIEPMSETQVVYYSILGTQSAGTLRVQSGGQTGESLLSAMDYICRAQQDLQEALVRLNK